MEDIYEEIAKIKRSGEKAVLATVVAASGSTPRKEGAKILVADGEAQAIKLVSEAADQYFKGNAQLLRQLQAVEQSLTNNAKVVVPANTTLVNVIGGLAGIETIPPKK